MKKLVLNIMMLTTAVLGAKEAVKSSEANIGYFAGGSSSLKQTVGSAVCGTALGMVGAFQGAAWGAKIGWLGGPAGSCIGALVGAGVGAA